MIFKEKSIVNLTMSEYFSQEIERESRHLLPPLSEDIVHYLTQLLIHFSDSRRLFEYKDRQLGLPVLALLYEDAYHASSLRQRSITLRHLGDSALFIGALFFDHFSKKGINKDYFIGMGGGAYSSLGNGNYENSHLFNELAGKFPKLLQVVAKVCATDFEYTAEDIFSLLKRWQQTKDITLKEQLNSIGISPFQFNERH